LNWKGRFLSCTIFIKNTTTTTTTTIEAGNNKNPPVIYYHIMSTAETTLTNKLTTKLIDHKSDLNMTTTTTTNTATSSSTMNSRNRSSSSSSSSREQVHPPFVSHPISFIQGKALVDTHQPSLFQTAKTLIITMLLPSYHIEEVLVGLHPRHFYQWRMIVTTAPCVLV
jgi:hypothetical protein